jgi:hypothetical protein
MELVRALEKLFEDHAPETLMALFGAATSILLFYLVWTVLRQLFGLQNRSADQDAGQDQATAALLESLVTALVTEGGHLREAMNGILHEMLRRDEQNAQLLAGLMASSQQTPSEVVQLLKPEFDHLRQAMRQTEARIVAKLSEAAYGGEGAGEGKPALAELQAEELTRRGPDTHEMPGE